MTQILDRSVSGTVQRCFIVLRDSSGDPVALAYNSSGISAKFYRPGDAAATAITLVTQTPNGAVTSGGFCSIEEGLHRIDLPIGASAAGVRDVMVFVKQSGIKLEWVRAQLSDFDPTLAPPTLQQYADGLLDLGLIKGRTLRKVLSLMGTAMFGKNVGSNTSPQLKSIDTGEANVLISSNGDRTTLAVDWANA